MNDTVTARADIANPANLRQLLAWVAERPRTYAEAMEAWRTSCPRLCSWEDATQAEMVCIETASAGRQGGAMVMLTGEGRRVLEDGAGG